MGRDMAQDRVPRDRQFRLGDARVRQRFEDLCGQGSSLRGGRGLLGQAVAVPLAALGIEGIDAEEVLQ